MTSRIIYLFSLCMLIALSTVPLVVAKDRWNSPRDLEPIIIKGENFIDFLNQPIIELYVYSYDATANSWLPIPFQIDQKDDSSHFWVPVPNNTLDLADELVFMAKDMGDMAADGSYWIDDSDSRNFNRVEITATDSISRKMAYVYLYRSKNILPLAGESYINYKANLVSPGADTVIAQNYIEGHNTGGVPDYWIYTNGSGVDILDRQKVQIDMKLYGFSVTVREDLLQNYFQNVNAKTGPVRLIRQVNWHIDIGMGIQPFDFSLPLRYYPYSVESSGVSGTLKASNNVNLIRQSFDLNSNATGMKLFNPDNKSGVTIDGVGGKEGVITTLYDDPTVNWWMVTGDQGTYAVVFKITPIGDRRSLYYLDDKKVLVEDDTGDMMSWGDTGIKIEGQAISGRISFAYKAYYLGANVPYSLGEALATNFGKPLTVSTKPNYYVPVEMVFFRALESDGNVVLEWATQTESNNYGFEIQRKAPLNDTWEVIATAKGQGTTTTPHKYSYTDGEITFGTYYYRLKQIDFDGSFEFSDEIRVEVNPPTTFDLYQNYPNPFNPETVIRYRIPQLDQASVPVALKIYNLIGDEVKTLVLKDQRPGYYSVVWDGKNGQGEIVAAGTYICQFRAGSFNKTNKMLLLR